MASDELSSHGRLGFPRQDDAAQEASDPAFFVGLPSPPLGVVVAGTAFAPSAGAYWHPVAHGRPPGRTLWTRHSTKLCATRPSVSLGFWKVTGDSNVTFGNFGAVVLNGFRLVSKPIDTDNKEILDPTVL